MWALAQFIEAYAQINSDFKSYLADFDPKRRGRKNLLHIQMQCMRSKHLKTIIGQVATAWSDWNQVNPRKLAGLLRSSALMAIQESIILNFTIIETGAKTTGNLNIHVIANSENPMASNSSNQYSRIYRH